MRPAAPHTALRAEPVVPLPVERLVVGKTIEEAADLLPRLFNLCRTAQQIAARAAFGLPVGDHWQSDLRAEIMREHVLRLCLKWPAALNLAALPLPRAWQSAPSCTRLALFGREERFATSGENLQDRLASEIGIYPMLRAIALLFPPGVGTRGAMPPVVADTFFQSRHCENSVAVRHASHATMQYVERRYGRGPLWSAVGVILDLETLLGGAELSLHCTQGAAIVPAARGLYGVRATILNGRVARFARVTPTDHLLAPGGVLDQSLASLSCPNASALAAVLLALLDPCQPVALKTAQVKEDHHA